MTNVIDYKGPDENVITTKGLTLLYGTRPAFAGIDFELKKNKITALVGPSGCGKSSFLNCLNRLIDFVPKATMSGEVFFQGENVFQKNMNLVDLRRCVGMIFQRPNPFPFSIRKNIEFPLRQHQTMSKDSIEHSMKTALEDVGLWDEVKDILDKSAMELSGGQQQRLCIARALALNPQVILMDEPCSSLDPISGSTVEQLISSLKSRFSVLMVTHNLAQARRISDYTALFWVSNGAGRMVEFSATDKFFTKPQHPISASYVSGAQG